MTRNNKKMNWIQLLPALLMTLLFAACGNPQSAEQDNSLEGLRAQLIDKQKEMKSLSEEIERIQEKIAVLDTAFKVRRLVTVDTVKINDFKHFVDVQGTIQSDEVVNISTETPGRITKLHIREGQNISRGQIIATLDMESVQRQMDELETAYSLATTVYERQARLWEQKIGSEIQFLEAKNNKERLEKSLASLKTQMQKGTIYAPTSGVVDRLMTKEGEYASPGMPIAVVVNTAKLKVSADVPEVYVGKVQKGERVSIHFPTLDEEISARVTMIGKTISSGNRTFKVEADLPANANPNFKPNLLALMKISDFEKQNAVQVPMSVIQQEASGKHFILLYKEGNQGAQAYKQYVTIGRSYDNMVLVEQGLNGGEVFILEGARGLANNELIEVSL